MRQGEVYIRGIKAGLLTEHNRHDYEFKYYDEYLQNEDNYRFPVSVHLPLRKEAYKSKYLFSYFYNMLSEGANRMAQALYYHLDPKDDFGILLETAEYDTIGTVTVKKI